MFPIAIPRRALLHTGARLLAVDVGGTKLHFAWFEIRNAGLTMTEDAILHSADYPSLAAAVMQFVGPRKMPETACIAFAGPIIQGIARATNLGWEIDTDQLSRELGIPRIFLINDLEAAAYGLALIAKDDLIDVWTPNRPTQGNAALISPGTGLGEAGLFWDGHSLHPFATEGGHADFAARNAFDWELLLYLQQEYGPHVSWERVLSGAGIYKIYCFLRDKWQWPEPEWLHERIEKTDPASAIGQAAQEDCKIARESLRVFVKYLSEEASNLALKYNALGGVFIGGGIIPKIWNDELKQIFLNNFFKVGRLRPLLETMPIRIVRNAQAPLLGAVYFGAGKEYNYSRLN